MPRESRSSSRPPLFRPAYALLLLLVPVFVQALSFSRAERDHEGGRLEEKRVEQRLPLAGRTVALESSSAEVVVSAGAGDEVHLEARLLYLSADKAWMQAVGEEFEVEVVERAGRIELKPVIPRHGRGRGWFSRIFRGDWTKMYLDLELTVPPGTALELANRYGDVAVRGVGGALQLSNQSGAVTVEGAAGKVAVENRYGNLVVDGVDGDLRADVQSGEVDIRQVTGDAQVDNRYGPIRLADVGGSLVLSTESGGIEVARVGGNARVSTSYGEASIEGVAGDLEVTSKSTPLRVAEVGGEVKVFGSYTEVDIGAVEGEVEVDNPGGSVRVRGAGGAVAVRNRYAEVTIEDARAGITVTGDSSPVRVAEVAGPVEITTRYGAVEVSGASGKVTVVNGAGEVVVKDLRGEALTARHRVEASYGDIDFVWPEDAPPPSFRLEATYRQPASDFPGTASKDGSTEVLTSLPAEELPAAGQPPQAQVDLVAHGGSPRLRRP